MLSKTNSVLKHVYFKGFTLACMNKASLYICSYTNKLAGLSCTFQQYSQVKQDQTSGFTPDVYKTYLAKLITHLHETSSNFPKNNTPKLLKVQLLLWCYKIFSVFWVHGQGQLSSPFSSANLC